MSDIQKKFEAFLTEDTRDLGQARGRAMIGAPPGVPSVDDVDSTGRDIENPDTVQKLNAYLSGGAGTPVFNPYFMIKRVQDKLSQIGLHFDVPTLVGDRGTIEKQLLQNGGRYGFYPTEPGEKGFPKIDHDDGISQRLPGGLNIKFDWTVYKGIYTIGVEIVPGKNNAGTIKENPLDGGILDESSKVIDLDAPKPESLVGKKVRSKEHGTIGFVHHVNHRGMAWVASDKKGDEQGQYYHHSDLKLHEDDTPNAGQAGFDKLEKQVGQKVHCGDCDKFHFEGEACDLGEVSPPGFSGTVKAMKKHKDIDNPFALAWYEKNKGYKSHKKAD